MVTISSKVLEEAIERFAGGSDGFAISVGFSGIQGIASFVSLIGSCSLSLEEPSTSSNSFKNSI